MIFALDPDLFSVADFDNVCQMALADLFNKTTMYGLRFAVDRGPLELEYIQLYTEWLERDPSHFVTSLLKQIVDDNDLRIWIKPKLTRDEKSMLDELECTEAVEPQLLGIIANARQYVDITNTSIRLLLVGAGIDHYKIRRRGLLDNSVQNSLKGHWPWLNVRFASDSSFKTSFFDEEDDHPKSREFEREVAFFLHKQRPALRCEDSPIPKKVDGKEIGDIDVFGIEREQAGNVTVVIGECKLRSQGKESKRPITSDEMQKHCNRLTFATAYLKTYQPFANKIVNIEGIFVSNTEEFEEGAANKAREPCVSIMSETTSSLKIV